MSAFSEIFPSPWNQTMATMPQLITFLNWSLSYVFKFSISLKKNIGGSALQRTVSTSKCQFSKS